MQLDQYFSEVNNTFLFSRQQASRFAKEIADDFNPIHDQDAKRFCVPGDLMFALVLARYGLSEQMHFEYAGMVGDGVALSIKEKETGALIITDASNKEYLRVKRTGHICRDVQRITELTHSYVKFSGHTFPHILVPLMIKNNVMINPDRPFVVYQSMMINLDQFDFVNPVLEITNAKLDITGKRGNATLEFCLKSSGNVVGHGEKTMVLSSLREFDKQKLDTLVDLYNQRKESYC
jgi:hypothetical protein